MSGVQLDLPCAAYEGQSPYAFISYAHSDAASVYPEIQRFNLMGYRMWFDEGIDPGNEWPEEVARALSNAQLFVVFVSRRALSSQNVRNEINFALKHTKRFIAIHIEETELPPGMDLQMSSIQAIYKWRMNEQSYIRNVEKAFPSEIGSMQLAGNDKRESNDIVELLARVMSSDTWGRSVDTDGKAKNWHSFDSAKQAEFRKQSESLINILTFIGRDVERVEKDSAPGEYHFTHEEVEILARCEHDSWARRKIQEGWRYGESRDNNLRLNPFLLPWHEIPDEVKNYDRQLIVSLPNLLMKVGYTVADIYPRAKASTQ